MNDMAPDGMSDWRALRARAAASPIVEDDAWLIVDLRSNVGSARWWRGAATLCGAGLLLGAMSLPMTRPLPQSPPSLPEGQQAEELAAAGISEARTGSQVGMRMAAGPMVEPLRAVPERPYRELVATLGKGDRLEAGLKRAGVTARDARAADAAVRSVASAPLPAGTRVNVRLGATRIDGSRPIEAMSLMARQDLKVELERREDRFIVRTASIAIRSAPQRIRGRSDGGLYWSLRAAGATPRIAADYLKAIGERVDVGALGHGALFDLVFEQRQSEGGERMPGPLLYAAISPSDGEPLSLLKWPVAGKRQWIDTEGLDGQADEGMVWPVAAPITSNYGMRRHPILRYMRMHGGLDFGARKGTPVVAAADGQVALAGWNGGHGRRVKIAHEGGVVTSYSHLSGIAVPAGSRVRRGEVIGYVGSSGLSTGPHLHYEISVGGRRVDPRSVNMVRRAPLSGPALEALKKRQREYLALAPMRVAATSAPTA
ncbi:M23 family metallopeptidase [Sphingomicrobium lutaoense]|uniref:Murein DD-endopeptidase MepM/ murein hydrolase activator NlpD n=1 Tax=Sphingomicrobium lutaoense TaxID=515949 RepID=A0A839Z514_9SPHN|nr:M23 family metallopeptidase [Sphingomicrobium lutaoense]MBB3764702.1 murein DD-endopeptidase MepM/ murein hydrolase activator NlpD [Sphingomicrobium lutaoense]